VSAPRLARTLVLVALLGVALTSLLVALIQGPQDVGPALGSFVDGVGGSSTSLGATGRTLTPVLLIAISAAISARAGLFDVGQVGQFLLGGLCAGAVAPIVPGPGVVIIVVALLAGAVAGGLWSILVGRLSAITGLQLVVLSLVANYLADGVAKLITRTALQDPNAFSVAQTRPVPEAAWLPTLLPRTSLHAGVLIAFAALAIAWLVIAKTAVGQRITMYGANPKAAALAGVNAVRFETRVLGTAGALCGLAGGVEVLGVFHHYQDATLGGPNSIAWTGLTAAILVPGAVLALLPASGLLAALVTGFAGIQRDLGIPSGLGTLLAGIVVVVAAFAVRPAAGGER
jgi:general nucleoside transport system permease protein